MGRCPQPRGPRLLAARPDEFWLDSDDGKHWQEVWSVQGQGSGAHPALISHLWQGLCHLTPALQRAEKCPPQRHLRGKPQNLRLY